MFFRTKKSGKYQYLQLVENQRVDGKVRQTVLATVGRLDRLNESGAIDRFVRSAARFGENLMILSAAEREGAMPLHTFARRLARMEGVVLVGD